MASLQYQSFQWNQAGYKELLGSAGIQNMVSEAAEKICNRANAAMPPENTYTRPNHIVMEGTKNKFSPKSKLVATNTYMAFWQQNQHKTLTTAIGA